MIFLYFSFGMMSQIISSYDTLISLDDIYYLKRQDLYIYIKSTIV